MLQRSHRMCAVAKAGAAVAFAAFLAFPAIAGAATITVDSATDDGTGCTLREAILSADMNSNQGGCTGTGYGDDTINFANGFPSQITLNGTELVIGTFTGGKLLIQGPGAGMLTVDGNNASRVFRVTSNAGVGNEATIDGLTIANGRLLVSAVNPQIRGVGILNDGSLTLDHARVTSNDLNVTDTAPGAKFAVASGAGIWTQFGSTLMVHDTLVDQNTTSATATGAGGSTNQGLAQGAGIGASGANLTVSFSTVSQNSATTTASGASSGNFSTVDGAGIFSGFGGTLTVDHTLVKANTTTQTASGAGASSTASGGGIHAGAQPSTIVESTIVDNVPSATMAQGGGVYAAGNAGSVVSLISDTLTGNAGSGPGNNGANFWAQAETNSLQNTILAEPVGELNCGGFNTITSAGHNLDDDGTCNLGAAGDLSDDGNVNLLALGDYGGPTETRPPSAFPTNMPSHAIDVGAVAGQSNDQRGFDRTWDFSVPNGSGDGTDIGAAELQGPTILGTTPTSPANDDQPEVFGFAEDTSLVKLYSTSDCSGTERGQGFDGPFASPGLTVTPSLATNSSTTLHATATIGTIVSECSPTSVT